jgi:hypothetical protein
MIRHRPAAGRRPPAVAVVAFASVLALASLEGASRKEGAWPRTISDTTVRVRLTGPSPAPLTVGRVSAEAASGEPVTRSTPAPKAAGLSEPQATDTLARGGTAARLLALTGFLLLIAGLLFHWSRDTSCKDERSVFSLSP